MRDFLSLSCSIEENCQPLLSEQIMTSVPAGNSPAFDNNMVHLSMHHHKAMPHRYQQSPVFKRKSHSNKHTSRYVHSHSHPTKTDHHSHHHRHKSSDDAKSSDAADAKVHLLSSLPWKTNHTSISEPSLDIALRLAEHPQRFHGSVMIVQEVNHEEHKTLPSSPCHRHRRHSKHSDTNGAKNDHCETIFCFDEQEFNIPVKTDQQTTVFSPIDTPTTPLVENFFNPEEDINNNVSMYEDRTFPTSPSTETLKNYDDIEFTTHDLGYGLLRRRSSDASISSTDTVT